MPFIDEFLLLVGLWDPLPLLFCTFLLPFDLKIAVVYGLLNLEVADLRLELGEEFFGCVGLFLVDKVLDFTEENIFIIRFMFCAKLRCL